MSPVNDIFQNQDRNSKIVNNFKSKAEAPIIDLDSDQFSSVEDREDGQNSQ